MNLSMDDWPVTLEWQNGLAKSPYSNHFYRVLFNQEDGYWVCEHKLSVINITPTYRMFNSDLKPIIQHDWVEVPVGFSTEKAAQNWAHQIESTMVKKALKKQGKWIDPDGKPGY